MLSEFQHKKGAHFFGLFDADKDGLLERDDFVQVVQRMGKLRGWNEGVAGYDELHGRWMFVWDGMTKVLDADGDERVTPEEFLNAYEMLLASEDGYSFVMNAIGNMNFDVLDADGDDRITLEEWRAFYQAHNIDPTQADEIFARLDTNGNGSLARDETLKHLRDFFYSDDPNVAGNYFFGKF